MHGFIFKYYLLFFSHYFGYMPNGYTSESVQNYFVSPLEIPLRLVGGFGEIRKNHFHTGIDIKTNEQEGLLVHAVASGYISRIKISAGGYGKAVFITHPNGLVSVYGHLQKLYGALEDSLIALHYQAQSFELDDYFLPNRFPIQQGQVIAYSGNTGGSTGPHLHFEIRDAYTEEVLNAQVYGFAIEDDLAPIVKKLAVYNWDKNPLEKHLQILEVKKAGADYVIAKPIVVNQPNVNFSLQAFDISDKSGSTQGIFKMQFQIGSTIYYQHQLEHLAFIQNRYCNAFADYALNCHKGSNWQHLYFANNNPLSIYSRSEKQPYNTNHSQEIILPPNQRQSIQLLLWDKNGNQSTLRASIIYEPTETNNEWKRNSVNYIFIEKEKIIKGDDIQIHFYKNTFYEAIEFTSNTIDSKAMPHSKVYQLLDASIPVQQWYEVQIKPKSSAEKFSNKLVLICESNYNGKTVAKIKWLNGSVVGKLRELGKVYLTIDTIAPQITKGVKNGTYRVGDNLSGVDSYSVLLDGIWILAELDGKTGILTLKPKKKIAKGKHQVIIKAIDKVGNLRTKEFNLVT